MEVSVQAKQALAQVRQVIVGKDNVLTWVMCAMLSGGHILLEDIPGVGKTTLGLAFAKTFGLEFGRVQFTPDVLPSDVTGFSMIDKNTMAMVYRPGAVLCNLFLADELNRATSRTQSALLEAMEEGQVTVDGVTHPIPKPFTVIATQNPSGAAGTQLLPDSQMDRFAVRLSLGYPDAANEAEMIRSRQGQDPLTALEPLMNRQELLAMQQQTAATFVADEVIDYIVALVAATRNDPALLRGASPRASLAVTAMAKALAQLRGRDFVIPGDVQKVFAVTVAHRLLLKPQAENAGQTPQQILEEILRRVPAPKLR